MSVVKDTLGWRGLGDVPSRCLAKFLCSPSLWKGGSVRVLKKSFAKSMQMFCAWKIKTRRQQLSHRRSPQPALRLPSLPSLSASPARSSAWPHPTTNSGEGDKRCVSTAQMTLSTLSAMLSVEHLVRVCKFSLY